jgi:uncharacterized protein involved in response to NO
MQSLRLPLPPPFPKVINLTRDTPLPAFYITPMSIKQFALAQLGFRPFFLFGSLFAMVSVLLWFSITGFGINPVAIPTLTPTLWHGHEMLYGYAIAVIAGFLLTAVRNWTGIATIHGWPLMLLLLLWLAARMMPFVAHPNALLLMALFDLSFNIALCIAILRPILKSSHYKSLGLWLVLVALTATNLFFYLELLGLLSHHVQPELDTIIYCALYLIIFLILLLGRRVIPMFISNGVGYPVTLTNRRWLDISCVVLLLIFMVSELLLALPTIAALCAALLCLLHTIRLAGWHTPGIWRKPLLWILYLAYGWIIIGFAITAAAYYFEFSSKFALHAFAYGGIGMMTIGMMARVSLGHTGRKVTHPPAVLTLCLPLLLTGSLIRVVMPPLLPEWHALWIGASQLLWICTFIMFAAIYAPFLIRPRIDGRPG